MVVNSNADALYIIEKLIDDTNRRLILKFLCVRMALDVKSM